MNKVTPNRLYSNITKSRIQKKLMYAETNLSPRVFNAIRVITTLILFIILMTMNKYSYIVAPTLSIIYYLLFEYLLLDTYINKKIELLEKDAIEYFEILVLENKKNKNIKQSILNTNKLLDNNKIKDYFIIVMKEINTGKTLEESLKGITNRIPSYNVKNLIYSLINLEEDQRIKKQIELLKIKENNRKIFRLKLLPIKLIIACIIFTSILIGYNFFLEYIFK